MKKDYKADWWLAVEDKEDGLTFKELAQGLLFLAALIASGIAIFYVESSWKQISMWVKGVCFGA